MEIQEVNNGTLPRITKGPIDLKKLERQLKVHNYNPLELESEVDELPDSLEQAEILSLNSNEHSNVMKSKTEAKDGKV